MDKVEQLYYLNAEMVKFLIIENLALKVLLHSKGVITLEEMKEAQAEAGKIVEQRTNAQLEDWKKSNSELVNLFKLD